MRLKNLIIGIMSCEQHRTGAQQAIKDTWLADLPPQIPAFFFEGRPGEPPRQEGRHVLLDCPDDYAHTALKSHLFLRYCAANFEFDWLLKCDDDTYIHVPRLRRAHFRRVDYIGNLAPGTAAQKSAYAQGGAYLLSRNAVAVLAETSFESGEGKRWWFGGSAAYHRGANHELIDNVTIEDMMIGDMLKEKGIPLTVDRRFGYNAFPTPYQSLSSITAHHITPVGMRNTHKMKRSLRARFKHCNA